MDRNPSSTSIRIVWPYIAVFALLAALLAAVYVPVISPNPYPYDSADYMYAGRLSFWANYVDQGSPSLFEFIQQGLELKNNPAKRAEMSQRARSNDDPQMYRHYHGPVYFYFLHALERAGVQKETSFRAAGIVVHAVTSLLVMFAFWSLFPLWPKAAGLVAGALYLFNRTAVTTAVEITQHIAFLVAAVVTLWVMGLFCRYVNRRYFHATMACLGFAFAVVETASLLMMTFAVVLIVLHRPIAERWPSWRSRIVVLLQGVAVFAAALFVFWPAGILKLSVLRGFVYLVYIAVSRKTFSPIGPLQTWTARFTASPWEHWPLFLGFVAALLLWRRLEHRREALPWLAYAFVFVVVTVKVTVEYVHYRGSIALVWTMATAIVLGYVWKRWGVKAGVSLAALLLFCSATETLRLRDSMAEAHDTLSPTARILSWVKQAAIPAGQTLYVPYYFVPALHLYVPELRTMGYDIDWPLSRLVSELRSPQAHGTFLCTQPVCEAVEAAAGVSPARKVLVAPVHEGHPLYAMTPAW